MTDQTTAAAVLARIRQMADYWEQHLPEVIRTPAVVSALRAALDRAPAVPLPPGVQSPIREQLLNAIDFSFCQSLGYATPEGLLAAYEASRTQTVDQAALREAADEAASAARLFPDNEECATAVGALEGLAERLRRVADETAATETDTLPSWLHWRFGPHGQPWAEVPDEDKSLWEHQARAVRRAVARGGFKQPAAGARQDGSAS